MYNIMYLTIGSVAVALHLMSAQQEPSGCCNPAMAIPVAVF